MVTTPASVADAGPIVNVKSSGLEVVFKFHVVAGTVPLAAASRKFKSVAAVVLTVTLSPPEGTVVHVWSPLKKVVLSATPEPNLAVPKVPEFN